MDEDQLNMAIRKFLKEVGVTSQREIERVMREGTIKGNRLRLRMTLTSDDDPELKRVVQTSIELTSFDLCQSSLLRRYCQVGAGSGLWQGLGHEHDVQPVPRLPLSG